MNVTVGTPPQPVILQVDTGSDEVWFPYTRSKFCTSPKMRSQCSEGTFDPSLSSTCILEEEGGFDIFYGDKTSIHGDYFVDEFGIGNRVVNDLVMGVATDISIPAPLSTYAQPGIFGIGPKTNKTRAGIVTMMKKNGLIPVEAYSIWLDDIGELVSIYARISEC